VIEIPIVVKILDGVYKVGRFMVGKREETKMQAIVDNLRFGTPEQQW
jgi:hypothetical protein